MISPTAHALLQLSLVKGVGPARMRKALHRANRRGRDLSTLLATDDLADLLSPDQHRMLEDASGQVEVVADELARAEVSVFCVADEGYPEALQQRLGESAPPLLMVRGNHALVQQVAVGFCGSRAASDRGLEVANDCADQLARAGVVVTSGYAAGVDVATHIAALRAGGSTTLVLAEGIMRFQVRPEIASEWSWDRACVVSEHAATAPWSAGNAMQRNRTIVGSSRAMILIEAGATGGSIAAGRNALEAGVPLFAPEYEGMPVTATGNRELLQRGARPLYRARTTMRANLEPVLTIVKGLVSVAPPVASQMPLLT